MTNLDAIHSDWRRIGNTTLAVYESEFRRVNSPMLAAARETYEAAKPHSALILAHGWMENQYNTTNIEIPKDAHNFLALRPERADDLGPYGSGVVRTAKTGQFLRFASFADCVRERHRRTWKEASTYKGYGPYKTTTTLESYLAVYAPAGDVHGVTGKDNADIGYLGTVTTMLKRFAAAEGNIPLATPAPNPQKEESPMAGYTITWPGLPGGPITFSFPVSAAYIVPASRTLQRPGIKARRPRRSVQHSNGNPNALAKQDTVYLYGGAGGRQASWHGTVDHKEGYANLPADEVGWHASDGAGPGNYNGFAVELSEYPRYNMSAADHRQARENAAEMSGRVSARIDAVDPDYHYDFAPDRKNCPRVIRENATWVREYEADWWSFFNDEKARMSGGGGGGGTTPASPLGLKKGDHIEVLQPLNIRQAWGTSGRLVTTLTAGTKGVIIDGPQIADGYTWWDIRIDGFGTGFVAEGPASDPFLKRIEAPAPTPPTKVYAPKSPIPELLETNLGFADMYNTAVAVSTVNETDFIFVADVIEFKRPSAARQYAGATSEEVMEPYGEGDRAIAAWITQIEDGTYWYVLTGGNDEWTRVAVADTVRIADAPLLGDDML